MFSYADDAQLFIHETKDSRYGQSNFSLILKTKLRCLVLNSSVTDQLISL